MRRSHKTASAFFIPKPSLYIQSVAFSTVGKITVNPKIDILSSRMYDLDIETREKM